MGAPRSGTTAVTHAINCHPLAFCGVEAFSINDSHKNISFPRSFDRQLSQIDGEKNQALKRLLEVKKATALVIGNKEPRYDLALTKILRELPHARLIYVYRNPWEFVNSWNRRALDEADDAWHRGQRGLFGVLSLFNYIRSLRQIVRDCLVLPYAAFSRDVAGTTTQIIRYVGIEEGFSPANGPAIQQLQFSANTLRNCPREVLHSEAEFLNAVATQELDAVFDREGTFLFSDIRGKVSDYICSLQGKWGQKFVEALVGYEDPHAIVYFRKLLHQPSIAAMFAEEAAFSPQLRDCLRALPRGLKLRRIFLRRNDLTPFERFMHRVQAASAH
jgi:hypothetical protein